MTKVNQSLKTRYSYLMYCDNAGNPLYVSQHLVWDADAFYESICKSLKENEVKKEGPTQVKAITQAEYFEFRKAGR